MIIFSGCTTEKVKYEDLPQTMQTKIQSVIQENILKPYIEKTIEMTSATGANQKAIIDKNVAELQANLKAYLAKEYPDIDFTTLLERSAQMK